MKTTPPTVRRVIAAVAGDVSSLTGLLQLVVIENESGGDGFSAASRGYSRFLFAGRRARHICMHASGGGVGGGNGG